MTDYFNVALTPAVLAVQELKGSRDMYPEPDAARANPTEDIGGREIDMITSRDSFYLATVSETGWPYLQHRGGEPGFVKMIDSRTMGWVERSGNRQYIGTGNITATGKVAAIFVDYPTRTRLKVYGRATYHPEPSDELIARLGAQEIRSDGAVTIEVATSNWNCPKYITPRFTEAQVQSYVGHLEQRIAELEAQIEASS